MERGRPAAGMLLFRRYAGEIQYLLLQKSSGAHHWSLPKGHVKKWEDPFMGAIRETFEDSGYGERVYDGFFCCTVYFFTGILRKISKFIRTLPQLPNIS